MPVIRLDSEVDFAGWRTAARSLRAQGVTPDDALWTVDGEGDLFAPPLEAAAATGPAFTTPREFLALAQAVVLHRSDDRFALLYRLLWRLAQTPHLLQLTTDPDVSRARDFAKTVDRAAHKMKAFVRFRKVDEAPGELETFAAWFEPAHRVTERTAPFFARRYANMRFSILTPDVCGHWDGDALSFTPGADPADAPADDALEDFWRTYYASIFNPARLKVGAMTKEMPKRYWRNLPEASLIPQLIEAAESRSQAMVNASPSEPSRRIVRAALRASRDAPYDGAAPTDLVELNAQVQACRRCSLWRDA
ncbi:MAG: TIGR03915 family putative DNA repair protein, partial [Phenylobacterium sp.]|uniref:TIGR03915 family putative DNA repair protein n=1 Tax=Phenylobacterium sp. TaxID=1871053 RepID=UPI002736CF4F